MQTTVYARTGSVAPRRLNITRQSTSFIEGSDQKIFDLGLALLQGPHPRISVSCVRLESSHTRLEFTNVGPELSLPLSQFPLVSPERIDRREHRPIIGLAGLQSRDSRFKVFQRRHRCILSRRSALGLPRSAGTIASAIVDGAKPPQEAAPQPDIDMTLCTAADIAASRASANLRGVVGPDG